MGTEANHILVHFYNQKGTWWTRKSLKIFMKFEVADLQLQSDCTYEKNYWRTSEFLLIKKTIEENSWVGGEEEVTVF